MNIADLKTGMPIWAAMGGYGWREGQVARIGSKHVRLVWATGRQVHGIRSPEQLRPRDPRQKGKDKPRPLDADESDEPLDVMRLCGGMHRG